MAKSNTNKSGRNGNGLFLFAVFALVALNVAGVFMVRHIDADTYRLQNELDSITCANKQFFSRYPTQNSADSALASEREYLRVNFNEDIQMVYDSIKALNANGVDLHEVLQQSVVSFSGQDSLQCFWYRWRHTNLLSCEENSKVRYFPYTTVDSLACVLLYPTVFKERKQ